MALGAENEFRKNKIGIGMDINEQKSVLNRFLRKISWHG
jgi:hypothetical protein